MRQQTRVLPLRPSPTTQTIRAGPRPSWSSFSPIRSAVGIRQIGQPSPARATSAMAALEDGMGNKGSVIADRPSPSRPRTGRAGGLMQINRLRFRNVYTVLTPMNLCRPENKGNTTTGGSQIMKAIALVGLFLVLGGSATAECYDVFGCSDHDVFRLRDLESGPNCEFLYTMRNQIYADHRYCFKNSASDLIIWQPGLRERKSRCIGPERRRTRERGDDPQSREGARMS